jgi:hypothetical protein
MSSKSAVSDKENLNPLNIFDSWSDSGSVMRRAPAALWISTTRLTPGGKILPDFFSGILSKIRWRNNLNSQSRCAFNWRMIGIYVP